MTILAVDLAAKYSAACLMDDDYKVIDQFDSFGISEDQFVSALFDCAAEHDPDPIVIEDLPHGLNYSTLVKSVCRLQGRIKDRMMRTCRCVNPNCDMNAGSALLFLAPATWRAHYEGMQRGTGPGIVVPVAERYGYRPPREELIARTKGHGGKSRADKIATDYCSAYLIARWAHDTKRDFGTFDVPGTSRYDTKTILKKDFDAQNR